MMMMKANLRNTFPGILFPVPDHYSFHRTRRDLEEFADREDLIVPAMAHWLNVDADSIEYDNAWLCFDGLNAEHKDEILRCYMDAHERMKDRFCEWWEIRYGGDVDSVRYELARDMGRF